MVRTLLPLLLLAGFAAGCHKTTPQAASCGALSSFDVSRCDVTSLSKLEPGGIWNTQTQWSDTGELSSGVFSLLTPGSETIGGLAAQDKRFDSQNFYLATTYPSKDSQGISHTYRVAMAGCGAQDAHHFGGQVSVCQDGQLTSTGLFKAAREVRAPGENESSHLALVSETKLPAGSEAANLYVANGYAYVAGFSSGLTLFDVHDPVHPSVVATLTPTGDSWNDAWVTGGVLFVASASSGILLYDVSNPAQPKLFGSFPSDKPDVQGLFIDGNRLYAASPYPNGEVLVYDISNPSAPVLLSRPRAANASPSAGLWPDGVFASGNTLYVDHWALGLLLVDVTDPTQPKEKGEYGWPDATNHASAVGTFNGKTLAFVGDEAWGGRVQALDVSDPNHIVHLSDFQLRPENSIHNMVLVGNKLYLAYYQEGIRVLDVSNVAGGTAPSQVGYFNTWRETDPGRGRSFYEGAIGIRVPGDGYLYTVESSRGLMIFQEN